MFSDFHQHIRHQVPHHASPQVSQGEKEESFYLHRGQARPSLQLAEDAVRGGDACPKACDMAWCFWWGWRWFGEVGPVFLGVGNVGRTQDAQCANMSMLNSDSIWQYWHQFISIWHLLAIKAQKMEPDKAWNVTFPTVYITVLVRFYAGLMMHTPTVFHISLCTRPPVSHMCLSNLFWLFFTCETHLPIVCPP